MRYIVQFDRLGRNKIVAPLVIDTHSPFHDEQMIEQHVLAYARRHLLSRDIDVSLDLDLGKGTVHAGIQTGGTFTIREALSEHVGPVAHG